MEIELKKFTFQIRFKTLPKQEIRIEAENFPDAISKFQQNFNYKSATITHSQEIVLIEVEDDFNLYVNIMKIKEEEMKAELKKKDEEMKKKDEEIEEMKKQNQANEKEIQRLKSLQSASLEEINILNTNAFHSLKFKTFRKDTCKILWDHALLKRVYLIKSTPYTGKSCLAYLLSQYIKNVSVFDVYIVEPIKYREEKVEGISKLYYEANNLEDLFPSDYKGFLQNIPKPTVIIIDEFQKIYDSAGILSQLKSIRDGVGQFPISKFPLIIILFAAYGTNIYFEEQATPLDLQNGSKGFQDIKFTNNEIIDLMQDFNNNHPEKNKIQLNEDLMSFIAQNASYHPGLIITSIEGIVDKFKDYPCDINIKSKTYLCGMEFAGKVQSTRAFPFDRLKELKSSQKTFLFNMLFIENGEGFFNIDIDSGKSLVKAGMLCEKDNNFFFVSQIIKIAVYKAFYCSQKLGRHIISVKNGIYSPTIRDICFQTLRRMNIKVLRDACQYFNYDILKEAVWGHEFYRTLNDIINNSMHNIIPEFSKKMNKGSIDFYINNGIKWGIEIFREDNRVRGHTKSFEKKLNTEKYENNEFLIINFRKKPENYSKKRFDYYPNLIRVCYSFEEMTFTVVDDEQTEEIMDLSQNDEDVFFSQFIKK